MVPLLQRTLRADEREPERQLFLVHQVLEVTDCLATVPPIMFLGTYVDTQSLIRLAGSGQIFDVFDEAKQVVPYDVRIPKVCYAADD